MLISDQRIPERPSLETHADVLQKRPELAIGIALAVALWSSIESRLEAIFLLCTRDEEALGVLQTKKGWDARSKFFYQTILDQQGQAAATEVRAILRTVAVPAKKRNEVAHGIWSICNELPNDLILLAPDDQVEMMRQAIAAEAAGQSEMRLDPAHMHATARVVTRGHLQTLYRELSEALSLIHSFMLEKMPHVVHVFGRENIPRAKDHPSVAARIADAARAIKGGA